jgi:hypothetical protein
MRDYHLDPSDVVTLNERESPPTAMPDSIVGYSLLLLKMAHFGPCEQG